MKGGLGSELRARILRDRSGLGIVLCWLVRLVCDFEILCWGWKLGVWGMHDMGVALVVVDNSTTAFTYRSFQVLAGVERISAGS